MAGRHVETCAPREVDGGVRGRPEEEEPGDEQGSALPEIRQERRAPVLFHRTYG